MLGLFLFDEFILLQVVAALVMYEVLASVVDPKGRWLPVLGV